MTTKHNCPSNYKEELKTEIIAQAAALDKKIIEFGNQRAEIVACGFLNIILAIWAGLIHPALFYVALVGVYAWLTWEWREVSKNKRSFMQQDHSEIHRLAKIFRRERPKPERILLRRVKRRICK